MNGLLDSYQHQADELGKLDLLALRIHGQVQHYSPLSPFLTVLNPVAGRPWEIVGVRLFVQPREILIRRVVVNDMTVVDQPVDAAIYAVDGVLPPLLPAEHPRYRGEALRFVGIRWGVVENHVLTRFEVDMWNPNDVHPALLEGYLVVRDATDGVRP